jgi:hypothetical protein
MRCGFKPARTQMCVKMLCNGCDTGEQGDLVGALLRTCTLTLPVTFQRQYALCRRVAQADRRRDLRSALALDSRELVTGPPLVTGKRGEAGHANKKGRIGLGSGTGANYRREAPIKRRCGGHSLGLDLVAPINLVHAGGICRAAGIFEEHGKVKRRLIVGRNTESIGQPHGYQARTLCVPLRLPHREIERTTQRRQYPGKRRGSRRAAVFQPAHSKILSAHTSIFGKAHPYLKCKILRISEIGTILRGIF